MPNGVQIPSAVVIAVDCGADITLVDAAADAVTIETLYRHRSGSWAECHSGISDHRRRHTTRIYDQAYYICSSGGGSSISSSSSGIILPPLSSRPIDNIRVMVIVWRLRENIIRTALCWIVWHNVHSQQHTYVSSSYRSNRLGMSHWDPYIVRRGSCLELCYCNMVEWFWWDSRLISMTNWFPSVLWHCCFGHLACKNRPRNYLLCVEWDVKPLHYYYYSATTSLQQ